MPVAGSRRRSFGAEDQPRFLQLRRRLGADAADAFGQVGGILVRSALVALVDDVFRGSGADALEGGKRGFVGRVDIDSRLRGACHAKPHCSDHCRLLNQ
ncbi:hypothetical protein RM96_13925 [Cupriavidus sp. IDO]|nr:hypothetical protein RM96_13925 [Cupriavidus sp. IDO]